MSWKRGNRLRLVREQEAPPETRAIYEELKEAVGLPYVSVVLQSYASFPHFLPLFWQRFQPVLQHPRFFELCDRLRAEAYTRAHNYFYLPDLASSLQSLNFSEGAREELKDTTEQFYYAHPLFLILVVAQQQAFDGQVGTTVPPSGPTEHPRFDRKPVLVDDESATPGTNKIFEEMKREFDVPLVSNEFRALARWPDFLRKYWSLLHPLLSSPLYQECQYGVRETAWSLARELPGPIELTVAQMAEAGMNEDDIASVVRLTQAFTRALSGSILNNAIAKIGLEGGNRPRIQLEEAAPKESIPSAPIRAA